MRIAILLPGEPRFTGDLRNFLNNLKGYDQADWFVYLTNSPTREDLKIKNSHIIPPHDKWINYDIEWATSKIIENLPNNNFLKKFEISDVHLQQWPPVRDYRGIGTDNIFNMYYNLYKVNQLRVNYEQENNFKYDAVIRTRTDIGLPIELNINNYDLSSQVVIMPGNRWYGEVSQSNDQFAFGNSDVMTIYSDVINHLEEYEKQVLDFGPEAILGHHLNSNKISYTPGNFDNSLRDLPLDPRWI